MPTLRDDEVLVEMNAAGVNLLDAKIRSGEFKLILRYGLPLVLDHDVARVDDFSIGTFAEFVPVKASSLASKPKLLTMAEAPASQARRGPSPSLHACKRQLLEIAWLVDASAIRPVVDKFYPFAATNEALAHVEGGRAKGNLPQLA